MIVAPSAAIASDRAEEDDRDREPAPRDAVLLQPLDRGVQRGREEDRDEDPDQDATRGRMIWIRHDRREDDPEHDEDRARAEADETLLHRDGAYGAARTAWIGAGPRAGGGNRTLVTSLEG